MNDGKKNGAGALGAAARVAASPPPPKAVADLAEACVRYVERAVGVKLDFEPETLPLLDHYIEQARALVKEKPEMLSIVVQTGGAYLGEVVRRRHAAWWRADGADPTEWQVELEAVFLAFSPMRLVLAALLRAGDDSTSDDAGDDAGDKRRQQQQRREAEGEAEGDDTGDLAQLTLEEDDRAAVAERLAELPQVSEQEFYAPSTRLEVIDIAVEAIRARRLAAGEEAEAHLTPDDYE